MYRKITALLVLSGTMQADICLNELQPTPAHRELGGEQKRPLNQRQLIKRNFELTLSNFAITELPGHVSLVDAWQQARTKHKKMLLLQYFLSTIFDAISIGARQSQIYPLINQLRDFVTDNRHEIALHDRAHLEMQLQKLENMRWTNA